MIQTRPRGPARIRARSPIDAALAQFEGAWRRSRAIDGAVVGIGGGAALAAALVLLARLGILAAIAPPSLAPLDAVDPVLLLVLAPVGGVAGWIVGWTRPVARLMLALEIDQRLDLQERVVTAFEIGSVSPVGTGAARSLLERQIAETVERLREAPPNAAFPIRLPRRQIVRTVLALAVAGVACAAPLPPTARAVRSQRLAATAQSQADRLDDIATQLQSQGDPTDAATRQQLAQDIQQAATDIRQNASDPSSLDQSLRDLQQKVGDAAPSTGEGAQQTLQRVADALNGNSATQDITRALDKGDVNGAASAMQKLAQSLASASPDQRQGVADTLQQAAQAASLSNSDLAQQLHQAADATRNGDTPANQAALSQAAGALTSLGQAAQAQQDVTRAQSALQDSQSAMDRAASQSGASASGQTGQGQDGQGSQSAGNQGSQGQSAQGQSDQGQGSQAGIGTSGQDGAGVQSLNQTGQGGSNGSGQPGGSGIGKGDVAQNGPPAQIQDLAQRQIDVPSGQQFDPSASGQSNQVQPSSPGVAHVDYRNVIANYQQQALDAMGKGNVPVGFRQLVKDYFTALGGK